MQQFKSGAQPKRQMTAAERAKLDAYRQQKAAAKSAQPTNIVDRAKQNANKYTEDTTLEQLEKEHKHSERESKAEAAYVAKEREEHRKLHTEPIPPSFSSISNTSHLKPWRSVHLVYILISILAQSLASVPPAPAWMER